MLEKIKKNKESVWGLVVFVSYFIYTFLELFPLQLLGIDYNSLSLFTKVCYLLGIEFLFIVFISFIFRKDLIKNFKDFFKNINTYIQKYIKYWFCAYGLMIISNFLIITLFPDSVATNQEIANSTFQKAPVYMFISAALFAPIVEEIIFRLSLRKIFKNDTLFIIISGLVFGSLHVIGSFEKVVDLIYIIPYSIPGLIFAYTLVKSKNIAVPISLHFFHNSFTMIMQAVLTFLV